MNQINCQTCGKEFNVTNWQLRNKDERRRPKFCSRECKYIAWQKKKMPWAKPDEPTTHGAGYVLIWAPNHPKAKPRSKRIFEHILVAEKMLGRYLRDDEHVHHKDRNKRNNDPSNLLVLTSSEHAALHARESTVESTKVEIECQTCGTKFLTPRSRAYSSKADLRRKYCSLPCRYKSWGRQMKAIRKKEN